MRQALRSLVVFLGTVACAPVSAPGEASARAGAAASDCETVQVEVSARDLEQAVPRMVAMQSPAGGAVWSRFDTAGRPLAARRKRSELNGRSPLGRAAALTSGFDVCFSEAACRTAPDAPPVLLFGCRHDSCSSKAAVVAGGNGRLLAISTTEFQGSKLELATQALLSGKGAEAAGGEDFAIFVEAGDVERDELRRLLASWFVLEHEFVKRSAVGNRPDLEGIAALPMTWRRSISARECVLA